MIRPFLLKSMDVNGINKFLDSCSSVTFGADDQLFHIFVGHVSICKKVFDKGRHQSQPFANPEPRNLKPWIVIGTYQPHLSPLTFPANLGTLDLDAITPRGEKS